MKTLLALLVFATPVQAFDMLPNYDTAPKIEKASHVHKQKAHKAKPKKRKAYSFRPVAPAPVNDGSKCYDRITVVGSQWVGESGAYESAVKAAKEAVRWQIGEMAMDPANWQDVQKRCSMSSVGEVVGQTFHRCEIRLTPCRPGMSEGAK
jgi:hypothetical protein